MWDTQDSVVNIILSFDSHQGLELFSFSADLQEFMLSSVLYLSGFNMMEGILTKNNRLIGSLQNLERSQTK